MANAFYSLYSHVSKTPVQKLAPPEFSFSSPIEKISMRFNSVKSEPKSPVDRLKDTVSKMCLYRGSRDLASPSPSPSASPRKRSSLPNVVEMVMENTKSEAFRNLGLAHFEEQVGSLAGAYLSAVCSSKDSRQCRSIPGGLELLCTLASDEVTWNSPMEDLKELSKQGCVDPDPSTLPQTARFTQDVICPRIIERVHKKPFSYGRLTGSPKGGHLGSANVTPDSGYKTSPCCQQDKADSRKAGESDVAEGNGTSRTTGQSRSRCPAGGPRWAQDPCEGTDSLGCTHLSHPSSGVWVPVPQCQITVTGWDGKVDPDAPLDKHSGTDGCTQNHDSWEPQDQSYMTPAKPPSLGSVLQHPPQENSFDLEEVHSAGEEDVSQSEARGVVTLSPLSAVKRHRDLMLREDSLQSDSSGFVEEDYQAHTSMGAEREEER
ncbi:TESP1 protein, partial [Amia calva]|nr:TESP1 protein [Amia calva]